MTPRTATIERNTRETQITLRIDLDTPGENKIDTNLPFLSHMLNTVATHGRFTLDIKAIGDIEVDPHHLVEDCGIVLGQAILKALGDYKGIHRAGSFAFPMDQTLAVVALDLCGRPNLVWNMNLGPLPIGTLDPHLFREFFKGLTDSLRATVHVHVPFRDNDHHVIEAAFKAFARAFRQAIEPLPGQGGALSTKGSLETQ